MLSSFTDREIEAQRNWVPPTGPASQCSLSQKQRQIRISALLFVISLLRKHVACRTPEGNVDCCFCELSSRSLQISRVMTKNSTCWSPASESFVHTKPRVTTDSWSPAAEWGGQLGAGGSQASAALTPLLQMQLQEELVALELQAPPKADRQ